MQPPTPVNARHARTDARKLDGAVEQLLTRTKTTQVTVVDLTARAPSTCSVASFLVRKRLKQACLALAPAKRGARVRHVVVGPSEALAQVPVAHDITRLRVASQGQQLQKNTVLIVGCDEVDETDLLLCDLSTETILKAAEDEALGPDGFTPADSKYASSQLEACWRRHGDGISTIRCGGGATVGWKPFVRLARALRGSLFDGTDQDGLDVALGRKAPSQLVRGADERTYAWERVHLTYAKTVGVSLVAAGALRIATPSASCMEILKQGVVAAVLGVVSVNVHQVWDGSLLVSAAGSRRFDE